MRVVSLVPSVTETLLALGRGRRRLHAVLRAATAASRRWHEGSRHRRDRRARTRSRRDGPRGEPSPRRRGARSRRRDRARHPRHRARGCRSDAVDAGRGARRARGGGADVRPGQPTGPTPACSSGGVRGWRSAPTPTARRCWRTWAWATCWPAPSATRRSSSTTWLWRSPAWCCCPPSRTRSRSATSTSCARRSQVPMCASSTGRTCCGGARAPRRRWSACAPRCVSPGSAPR